MSRIQAAGLAVASFSNRVAADTQLLQFPTLSRPKDATLKWVSAVLCVAVLLSSNQPISSTRRRVSWQPAACSRASSTAGSSIQPDNVTRMPSQAALAWYQQQPASCHDPAEEHRPGGWRNSSTASDTGQGALHAWPHDNLWGA